MDYLQENLRSAFLAEQPEGSEHFNRLQKMITELLQWYSQAARDLPWRKTKDPYCIWISEIMLQQTRVEAVKEYYRRFLRALPDIESLANASEEQVLKLWEGLGYYSRARNLKKAAEMIVTDYNGIFPREIAAIRKLPGIGAYTAGAVSSIAFGLPEPAVDGNVLRVLSRVLNDDSDIMEQKTKDRMTKLLKSVYPKEHCGDVTQSLMELGAIVCIPNGQPKCGECPLGAICMAKEEGTVGVLPVKSGKAKRKIEQKTVFLLQCGNEFAIRKRQEKGLLSGMWELPNESGNLSEKEICNRFEGIASLKKTIFYRHIFTHIEWKMQGYHMIVEKKDKAYFWATLEEISQKYAIPGAFRPFLKQ